MKNLIFLLGLLISSTLQLHAMDIVLQGEPLKAVLIVGPQEDGTKDAIAQMNRVAGFLKSKGVEVHSYYDKNSDWENIKKAADGASILVYSGHGNASCGFNLTSTVSNEEIVKNLKLKKGALVLFQSVCYGAGSSAGDDTDIGIKEAEKRVTNYAKAFIEKGAGCYFAINSNNGVLDFLQDFYAGKTVHQCLDRNIEFFYKIEKDQKSALGENMKIVIASSDWGGTATLTTYENGVKKVQEVPNVKSYSIAYVANPDFSIKNFIQK